MLFVSSLFISHMVPYYDWLWHTMVLYFYDWLCAV